MFCPHCGTALPNGLDRCNYCGGTLKFKKNPHQQQYPYQAPAQPRQQAPQQPSQPQAPRQQIPCQPMYQPPKSPVPKKEFLRTCKKSSVKTQAILLTVTAILSVVLILVSAVIPLVRPVLRLRSMDGILSLAGVDTDELVRGIDTVYEELARELDLNKSSLSDSEVELAQKVLRTMKKLSGSFTLIDLQKLATELNSDFGGYLEDLLGSQAGSILRIVTKLPTIAICVILACFLLPLILTVLAGLKKNMGLTIAALVISLLPQMVFNGYAFATLTLIILIPQAVFCANLDRAYKNYQLGIL